MMLDGVAIQFDQLFYSAMVSIPRFFVVLNLLPFLTEAVMPAIAKQAYVMALSAVAFPYIYLSSDFTQVSFIFVIALMLKEALIGLLIAFLLSIPFWALASAGFLVDLQRGAFSATLFTPFFRGIVSPTGILLIQSAATLIFTSGAFLTLLEIIYGSFYYLPPDEFFNIELLEPQIFIEASMRVIMLTFTFAAPLVILMFCIDFTLGIANRFVPELNVFFISLPVKSVLAFVFLAIYLPFLFRVFGEEFTASILSVKQLIGL